MSKEKRERDRETDYPVELESQLIMRVPEEPAKLLREVLKTGDGLKNRLSIQIDDDMRHGQVRFDHWLMHAKIVDLPTIVESLKTIDNKSFYKSSDICQMMICKDEADQSSTEEETPVKNKKKDNLKVDKKFLWPHGITPPTKNVRKRRFRKTLKKKFVEAPEVEKEVKRLLRADNEAESYTWEVVKEEEEENKPEPSTSHSLKQDKKPKSEHVKAKRTTGDKTNLKPSNVVDIFGGAVSDSDLEDENVNVDLDDSHLSAYDSRLSDNSSMLGTNDPRSSFATEFDSQMFSSRRASSSRASTSRSRSNTPAVQAMKGGRLSSEDDAEYNYRDGSREDMSARIEQLRSELEGLKQRKQRTQHEITGMENMALRQRFQDNLHILNQEIMHKDMEYQGLLTLLNSEDI